ncbi:MAG: hypothetical protein IPK50_14590 [Fibrobacterota bacterium]|nr:MAG: hypothetical protein IPK50_14590 [Fibrobacterota bacterium]
MSASSSSSKPDAGCSPGPDYSGIDSQAKAEALFERGELAKLLLMPTEFGGLDVPENVVYVPAFVLDLKSDIERNIIMPMAAEGKVTRYAAEPQYQGDSFIPTAIKVIASNPGNFSSLLKIWGTGLSEG